MSKRKTAEPQPETMQQALFALLDQHIGITKAIVADYIGGPGMEEELAIAYGNLKNDIEQYCEEKENDQCSDFDSVLKKLKELKENNDVDFDELLELCKGEGLKVDNVIALCDEGTAKDAAISFSYACIKVDNLNSRIKLENFIQNELYPNHRDQEDFVSLPL